MKADMTAEKMMYVLDFIEEYAHETYDRGDFAYEYSGTREAKDYFQEYAQQVYFPLIRNFNEKIELIFSEKKFDDCNGKLIFRGDYVRVKRSSTALDGDKYIVYCAPFSVCKSVYRRAKADPNFPK